METSYVVLREGILTAGDPVGVDGKTTYLQVGNFSASSASAAIRAATEEYGEGTYVAVPARSFKPTVVKVQTKTVVSFA